MSISTTTIDVESTKEPSQALTVHRGGEVGAALPPEQIRPPVTAAQAKIDAVASLTMKAYERAATLHITPEEASKLLADFPDEAFKPGAAGKEHLIYIEHAYLRDRLSEVFGMGQWAIIPRNRWAEDFTTFKGIPGSRVYVEAMLVIRGCFVAEAVGAMEYYPKNESQNYGDACEGAKTAAFRRCAKELGVGLQAWKKDWCYGWWARLRARKTAPQRPQPAPQPTGSGQRVSNPPTPAPTPPASNAVRPKHPAIFADEETRKRMIGGFLDAEPLLLEYFHALDNPSVILPTEGLNDIPLRFVPVTVRQFELLRAAVTDFGNGDKAVHAFPANPEPPPAKKAAPAAEPTPVKEAPAKIEQPSVAAAKAKDPEWFFEVICPIPNKGQRRDDYLKHPDTIRSLYLAMKNGDDLAQKRLWGFASHYQPEPRTVGDKTYQPSAADHLFREALDAFCDWEKKHGKDTENPDAKESHIGTGAAGAVADHEPGAGEPQDGPDDSDNVPF